MIIPVLQRDAISTGSSKAATIIMGAIILELIYFRAPYNA
jgi:hypothetical protein